MKDEEKKEEEEKEEKTKMGGIGAKKPLLGKRPGGIGGIGGGSGVKMGGIGGGVKMGGIGSGGNKFAVGAGALNKMQNKIGGGALEKKKKLESDEPKGEVKDTENPENEKDDSPFKLHITGASKTSPGGAVAAGGADSSGAKKMGFSFKRKVGGLGGLGGSIGGMKGLNKK